MVDMELCQLDRIYLYNLTKYNKILEQRNNLLKQIVSDARLAETLLVWNEQLVKYGSEVIRARKAFVGELNSLVGPVHSRLCGGREELKLCYEPNIKEDDFLEALSRDKEKELILKSTLHGPHRDDISF